MTDEDIGVTDIGNVQPIAEILSDSGTFLQTWPPTGSVCHLECPAGVYTTAD